ncbi:uncharacterized protein LOC120284161 [Dioscorea cayenensis subsp. rotundata]|uniref:Uncharacterized protein LOC120284161 n=1 Tax=Dioscorea cayennensis subsp. rotundata TaxID=55577 RepID=A0AB40D5H3_DIOCR|nr:uncharacterized protein LOC120284161 [Dioscorea cayenensis subsp. rotundata]
MTEEDAHVPNAMVLGTLSVYSAYACALFDFGATHSFISSTLIRKHVFPVIAVEYDLCVTAPLGVDVILDRACENCLVIIIGHELLAHLHVIKMSDYDVILGMNFLSACHAVVDCHAKRVVFKIRVQVEFTFHWSESESPPYLIFPLQAQK